MEVPRGECCRRLGYDEGQRDKIIFYQSHGVLQVYSDLNVMIRMTYTDF